MPNLMLSAHDSQVCWNVPRFINIVTSALTCDVDNILKGLSQHDSPNNSGGKISGRTIRELYVPQANCERNKGWKNWPRRLYAGEAGKLVSFINEITAAIRGLDAGEYRLQAPKDLVFADLSEVRGPPCASYLNRMPDFALVERSKSAEPKNLIWSNIYCVGDFEANNDLSGTANRLLGYAQDCFLHHHGRRFVLGLGFLTDNFAIFLFDRSGIISSQLFNIHQDPIQFIRGVACLPFLDEVCFGLDHTLSLDGCHEHILSEGLKYKVTREIYRNYNVIGKGTLCLEVEDEEGGVCVAKDSWLLRPNALREVKMLDLIRDMKNVPRIISYENVPVLNPDRSFYDNTEPIRDAIRAVNGGLEGLQEARPSLDHDSQSEKCDASSIRDHMRLIISPLGEPLRNFKSLPELVSATLDIIETIDELDKRGIVHGDISYQNIVLVPTKGSLYRSGYLIDFESAIKRGSEYFRATDIVTLPFMATGRVVHGEDLCALHDAESLFYVLIYITLCHGGPGGISNKGFTIESSIFGDTLPPNEVFKRPSQGFPRAKFELMCDERAFESKVLDRMHSYFSPLRKLLSDLREFFLWASFRVGRQNLTHQAREEREALTQSTKSQFKIIKDILHSTLSELKRTGKTVYKEPKDIHRDSYLLRPRPCPRPLKRPATEQADDGAQEGRRKRYKPRRKSAVQKK